MGKIYVLLEISSSSQLRKTNHDVLDLLLERLERLCLDYGGTLIRHSGDLFLYLFPNIGQEVKALLERLMEFYLTTRERKSDLQGVTVFVERFGGESDEDAYTICRDDVYRSGCTEGFLIGRRLEKPASGCSFNTEEATDILKAVVSAEREAEVPVAGPPSILHREKLINRILEIIVPEIDDSDGARIVHIYGPAGSGKAYNLKVALRRLAKNVPDAVWAVVPGFYPGEAPEGPFLKGMNNDFLRIVPEYLLPREKTVWDARRKAVLDGRGDRYGVDFILIYRLYLQAYIRRMDELGLPPLFICEAWDRLSPGAAELCVRFCLEFISGSHLVPVIVSETRDTDPRLESMPRVRLKVTPVQPKVIEHTLALLKAEGRQFPAEADTLYEGDVHSFIMALGLSKGGGAVQRGTSGAELARILAGDLSPAAGKYLLSRLASESMFGTEASVLLDTTGLPPGLRNRGREECVAAGLIDGEGGFHFPRDEIFQIITDRLEQAEHEFKEKFAETLAVHLTDLHNPASNFILLFICRHAHYRTAVAGMTMVIDALIDNGRLDTGEDLLEELSTEIGKRLAAEGHLLLELTTAALRLRIGVLKEDQEACRRNVPAVDEIDELGEKTAAARYRLEYARYLYMLREFRKSLSASKRALFLLEESAEGDVCGAAYTEVGLSMLSLGKTGEAAEYFTLATELGRDAQRPLCRGRALILEAEAEFFMGGLDRALKLLVEAAGILSDAGFRNLELFAQFFQGRIFFRLGMYRKAAELFFKALSLIDLYGIHEARKTVYAWLARSEIFLLNTARAIKTLTALDRDYETGLFFAEACYMDNRPEEGIRVLEDCIKVPAIEDFRLAPGEVIRWKNGFSNLEDRVLSSPDRGSVLSHLVRGFNSYLLGRTGGGAEAYIELMQLTRGDKLGESDQNNMLYYFFASDLLTSDEEDEEINRLTLLSKALKYLQGTASRIGDPKLKQAYLWQNYWNAKLMEEGREHKLV